MATTKCLEVIEKVHETSVKKVKKYRSKLSFNKEKILSAKKNTNGDNENKDINGDDENKNTNGGDENKDTNGDNENKDTNGDNENKDTNGGDDGNKDTNGGDDENKENKDTSNIRVKNISKKQLAKLMQDQINKKSKFKVGAYPKEIGGVTGMVKSSQTNVLAMMAKRKFKMNRSKQIRRNLPKIVLASIAKPASDTPGLLQQLYKSAEVNDDKTMLDTARSRAKMNIQVDHSYLGEKDPYCKATTTDKYTDDKNFPRTIGGVVQINVEDCTDF